VSGEELSVALQQLSSADQKRLLGLVRGLPLASSPSPPITTQDILRRGWRRLGWILAATVVVFSVMETWLILRRP
jgi:hypothetical protein